MMFSRLLPILFACLALAAGLTTSLAQAPCKTTFECAQRAVEAAAKAEASVAALSKKIDDIVPRLSCDRAETTSPHMRFPQAVAKIPGNLVGKARVTGGGCEVPGGNAQYGHNPPITRSIPVEDGWICEGFDPPSIPVPFVLKAYVVYCSVSVR